MYLPQYHRIPENDEWWGEGFTDWVAVKNATQLFDEHYQPRHPLNDNYYDLLDVETLKWQSGLMNHYGIDGMCIYHYWFKDGRKILARPSELLLENKEISIKFCFCWANETWARSWSGIRNKNSWFSLNEKKNDEKGDILLLQAYGEKEAWKEHFDYLLPFFSDPRYLKENGKPIFVFYKAIDIPCLDQMICYWQELAVEAGFSGMYFIGANAGKNNKGMLDDTLRFEPGSSMRDLFARGYAAKTGLRKVKYDDVWERVIKTAAEEKGCSLSAFVDYDDTPRRGNEGIAVIGATPEAFKKNLVRLFRLAEKKGIQYIFLNAWNEWGEGMYLEPDELNHYAYLEAFNAAKNGYDSKTIDVEEISNTDINDREIRYITELKDRMSLNVDALDEWLSLYESGVSVADYLIKNKISRVVIYGYGVLGRHLFTALQQAGIQVSCIIEQNKSKVHTDVPAYCLSEEPETTKKEYVVVTAMYYYDQIEAMLKKEGYTHIVSILTLIHSSMELI